MEGLIAKDESFTAHNTLAINGLKYEPDLQAGFFKETKQIENESDSMWYAKAKILSNGGWADFASFFLRAEASNNPNRLKLLIPQVSRTRYIGLGTNYGIKTIDFFVTFENDNYASVYFRFHSSVVRAYLKCSNNASFEIVNEPLGATWVAATGYISTI